MYRLNVVHRWSHCFEHPVHKQYNNSKELYKKLELHIFMVKNCITSLFIVKIQNLTQGHLWR